jgi:hypothetical protein
MHVLLGLGAGDSLWGDDLTVAIPAASASSTAPAALRAGVESVAERAFEGVPGHPASQPVGLAARGCETSLLGTVPLDSIAGSVRLNGDTRVTRFR